MTVPNVSICITTYNRRDYLRETLESIFAQTYKDYEVIIVDDGSTDGTEDMIRAAGYDVRYYWQQNRSEAVARNKLIELARGHFIAFIDSDDLLTPKAIEMMVAAASASDDVVVYGPYLKIDASGNICGKCKRTLRSGFITKHLFEDIIVHPNGSLYPKRVLEELGGFDTSLRACTDYDLELRASLRYRFIAIDEPTFKHRRHSGNASKRSFDNRMTEMFVLERFYSDGGIDAVPRNLAMKRLSKEGYRAARCAIDEDSFETARRLLWQSFRRYPNFKSAWWLFRCFLSELWCPGRNVSGS